MRQCQHPLPAPGTGAETPGRGWAARQKEKEWIKLGESAAEEPCCVLPAAQTLPSAVGTARDRGSAALPAYL